MNISDLPVLYRSDVSINPKHVRSLRMGIKSGMIVAVTSVRNTEMVVGCSAGIYFTVRDHNNFRSFFDFSPFCTGFICNSSLGSIAGDNTIFLVVDDAENAPGIVEQFNELLK